MVYDGLLGLPKPIRDALARLANEQRVAELVAQLEEHLRLVDVGAEMPDLPEFNMDRPLDDDWNEGVEEFKSWSMADLWSFLGVERLPFFNERFDIDNGQHFWDDQQLAAVIKQSGSPLTPRWHQLVGIVKMVTNCFQGRPVLLMDNVGIGKTLQVVGLVSVLTYFREYFAQHGRFPGKLGEFSDHLGLSASTDRPTGQDGLKWPAQSGDGNIPDRPCIFVVPTSLMSQFMDECRRYLEPQSFDLLPYIGTMATRGNWWSTVFDASKHRLSRRIVISTTSVGVPSFGPHSVGYMSDDVLGHRLGWGRDV